MFADLNVENQVNNKERKIQQLSIQMDTLDREIGELLTELQVTPEQLTNFVERSENFTEKNWKEMMKHRSAMEEKLSCELKQIQNPKKTKDVYADRHMGQHWLFVR
jgi:DNA repair ATPase RecN